MTTLTQEQIENMPLEELLEILQADGTLFPILQSVLDNLEMNKD